ncbi:MAG: hypothetical protein K0R50_2742 [Eubacterium sp.]|nr:hypothetical protein [Eubacterium sp.]
MKRNQAICTLAELAGSLGPYGTLESRLEATVNWHNSLDLDSIDVLIDILLNPPLDKEINKTPEYFEGEIIEALTSIGKRDATNFLKKAEYLINLKQVRPVIIDVIGGLRCEGGIFLLESLLKKVDLNDDELVRIVSSLAEIEGSKTLELLEKMKKLYYNRSSEVLQQINIWLGYFKNRKDR